MANPNRYLQHREGRWFYRRRVPKLYAAVDTRGLIRVALKTRKLAAARKMRDELEAADDKLWAAYEHGDIVRAARAAAEQRAKAFGFQYEDAETLAAGPLDNLMARLDIAIGYVNPEGVPPAGIVEALLGGAPAPSDNVRAAFRLYLSEIEAGQRQTKSEKQYKKWRQVKERAVNNFLKSLGKDKPMPDITRSEARAFHRWLQGRVDAGDITSATAARDFGNMRQLFRVYMDWTAPELDSENPFDGLKFKAGQQKKRPPFTSEWITDKLLSPGALDGMDSEAQDILLTLIDTGARPAEIANLAAEDIVLDGAPYLNIKPRQQREIKTRSSARQVPLVGVALAAMRRHPDGFPRWRENEKALSHYLLKQLRTRNLMPTPDHVVYSLRHSFEDRMKEAGLDYGLRCELMGHAVKRPQYGAGVSMEWKAAQLAKIVLPCNAT